MTARQPERIEQTICLLASLFAPARVVWRHSSTGPRGGARRLGRGDTWPAVIGWQTSIFIFTLAGTAVFIFGIFHVWIFLFFCKSHSVFWNLKTNDKAKAKWETFYFWLGFCLCVLATEFKWNVWGKMSTSWLNTISRWLGYWPHVSVFQFPSCCEKPSPYATVWSFLFISSIVRFFRL